MRTLVVVSVIWLIAVCAPSSQSQETNPSALPAQKESGEAKNGVSSSTGVHAGLKGQPVASVAISPDAGAGSGGVAQEQQEKPPDAGSGQKDKPAPSTAADQSAESTTPTQPEKEEGKKKKK